jgi:predicted oxidoreductase
MTTEQADLLVIGAGGAGVSAAIEAAERGARVLLVDADRTAGGTARTAGGGTCIAGSPLQARDGIDDSPDKALADWVAWGGPSVDVEWARRYLEASVPELFIGLAALGVHWMDARPNEGNSVPRWHAPRGGGLAVMQALETEARKHASISWQLGTRVSELDVEGGRVVGAAGVGPSGEVEYRAGAVVLASGGFANNLSMVREHAAAARSGERILLGGGEGALGQGHRMLERLGAQFVNLDAVWMYPYATPDPRDPTGAKGLVVRGLRGDVWVNQQGRRFHNETLRGGATGTAALLAQRPASCWSVIDAGLAERAYVSNPYYRHGRTPHRDRVQQLLDDSPHIGKGQSLEEAADRQGIAAGQLVRTISAYNHWIATGQPNDPDFGKPLRGLEPIDQPPFYAIRFFPLARKNLGGVRTDLDCRVLDTQDRPIEGLFAVGELAGMAGGRINGRAALEGTMFGPSIYSGRIAGRTIAG